MEEYEDDFQQSGGGSWIKWLAIIAYIAIIVAYAVQTLELVGWLFPADNVFMKGVTVFVCDGCAVGYAMAEMFYRFRLRKSKYLVFGMWIVTFVLSTAASVIQMYLSSTHNIPHSIDSTIISVAYGVVIIAFVVNIIAITVVIRMEYAASQPQHRYLDDGRRRKQPPQTVVVQQEAQRALPPRQRTDEELKAEMMRNPIYREWFEWMEKERAKEAQPQTSPLQSAPLSTQASHEGNQNGKQ